MKIRLLLRLFSLVSLIYTMVFGLSVAVQAQDLPWQQGAGSQGNYGHSQGTRAGNSRKYVEPGQPYNSSRQTTAPRRYEGQGTNNRTYDSGYDALRNNNRAQQPGIQRNTQPYAGQGNQAYQGNQNYQGGQPYQGNRSQGRYDAQQPGRAPSYGNSREPYPQQGYRPPVATGPGQAYAPPSGQNGQYRQNDRQTNRQRAAERYDNGTYSDDEILNAGHRFFGKITKGLAKVIAHVFKKSGRPNAYILGEEGGGALIAGLRYGEGTVYTKAGDKRRIYWQGPSIGYDFGAEGAKTMILVYNLRNINEIYQRFGGVDGSAYLVGGVGVTFQKRGRVVMAPIRTGIGLRLGANIGYLKYTRRPTWNPF